MNAAFVRLYSCLLLSLLGLLAGSGPCRAEGPRVVILLTPGLRADDLARPELPTLRRMLEEGAGGWMICRAARVTDPRLKRSDGRETTDSLLLTLGSGARAIAGQEAGLLTALAAQANASKASPPPALRTLQAVNSRLDHPVPLGALGDLLHRLALRTAVLGNFDAEAPDHSAFALAMDSAGRVDFAGDRMNRNRADNAAPYGFRADMAAMLADCRGLEANTALVALAFGDLHRADRYAPFCLPSVAAAHRTAALRALDAFLAEIQRWVQGGSRTVLLLLSPGPADSVMERQDRLAPVLLWGADSAPGTLTSASTRRAGLVLNTDLLATIAALYQQPLPSGATGRPMIRRAHTTKGQTPEAWRALHTEVMRTARQQNVLGGWPTVQACLVLAGTLALAWRNGAALARAAAVAVVALPVGMLLLPQFAPKSVGSASALTALFAFFLACAAAWGRGKTAVGLYYSLCGTLLAIILVDLLTGSRLLQQAWMSYSVVEAARFYGIGNEYMGTVIGAACVLAGIARARRIEVFALLYGALLLAMGLPQLGAKVGAIPSAGAAFGVTLLMLWRKRLQPRDLLLALVSIVALLAVFTLLDLRHPVEQQTHLARAFSGAGGDNLLGIVRRKLLLEGYLLLHSPWSATLAIGAFGLWRLRRASPETFASEGKRNRAGAVLAGITAGAIASLLCNDSGVTAAALIVLYGWAWAILRAASPPAAPLQG